MSENTHVVRSLTVALEALSENLRVAGLIALLEAWQALPHSRLAGLIERLGASIDASLPTVEGKRAALADAWLDVAGAQRSSDVGRLLAAMEERASAKQMRDFIPVLESYRRDPRIGAAMVRVVGRYTSSGATPTLQRALAVVEHVADPRGREALLALDTGGRSWLDGAYKKAARIAAGLPAPDALDPALESVCEAIDTELVRLEHSPMERLDVEAPVSSERDTLLTEVFAQPDSDDPRRIFADWLIDQNDPWGTFIQLQLEPSSKRAALKAAKDLQKSHGSQWMGTLVRVVKKPVFERGFLTSCSVDFKTNSPGDVLTDPHWSTVRQLAFATDAARHPLDVPELLLTSPFARLTHVENVSAATAAEVFMRRPELKLESLTGLFVTDRVSDADAENDDQFWSPEHSQYQRADRSYWQLLCENAPPSLKRLGLEVWVKGPQWDVGTGFGWLQNSPLGAQLEHVELVLGQGVAPLTKMVDWFSRMSNLQTFGVRTRGRGGFAQPGPEVLATLSRREDGFDLLVTLTRPFYSGDEADTLKGWVRDGLRTLFADVPPNVHTVAFDLHRKPTKKDRDKLRREVGPLAQGAFRSVQLPDGPL